MTKHPRRTLAILALAVVLVLSLAGCSRRTTLSVQADLVSFLGPSSTQATVPYPSGAIAIDLPPNDSSPRAGTLVDLDKLGVPLNAIANVNRFAFDFAIAIRPTSAVAAGSATLYIAEAAATDVFQPQYEVAQITTAALAANQTTALSDSFILDAGGNAAALARIQAGSFRLGVQLKASTPDSGDARVDLTRLLVSVSLPPGWGLP